MKTKKTLIWKEFNDLCKKLAKKIPAKKYTSIYGIPRGGLFVAQQLSNILGLPVSDRLHHKALVVDDICDSGASLAKFQELHDTAVLHYKPKSRVKPTYFCECTNNWVQYPYEVASNDETVEDNVRRILQYIGEDVNKEGIKCTPTRVARMYNLSMYGYRKKLVVMDEDKRNNERIDENIIPITIFKSNTDELLIRKTKFISFCQHHMVPFYGTATVGIIPEKRLLGMNKIDKIVKFFAARLQIQEDMGKQIADWIDEHIKPKGVIVVLNARHFCAEIQGDDGDFTTSTVRGIFLKPDDPAKSPKQEFLDLIK